MMRVRSALKNVLLVFAALLAASLLCLVLVGLIYTPAFQIKPAYDRQFLEIDGARIAYHQAGAGPDVLLLHGAMGSVEDWTPILTALSGSHRLTVFDRPGFYRSAPGSDRHLSLAGNADLAAGVIRILGLQRPLIVGHSHGGSIALVFAARHPELARGVVTLDTSGPAAYRPGLNDRLLTLPLFGRGLAVVVGGLVGPNMIRATLGGALAPRAAAMPDGFLSFRMKLWSHPDSLVAFARQNLEAPHGFTQYADRFGELKPPLAMVYCERPAVPAAVAIRRAFAHGLIDDGRGASRLVRLENCNHYVQHTNTAAVARLIQDF